MLGRGLSVVHMHEGLRRAWTHRGLVVLDNAHEGGILTHQALRHMGHEMSREAAAEKHKRTQSAQRPSN